MKRFFQTIIGGILAFGVALLLFEFVIPKIQLVYEDGGLNILALAKDAITGGEKVQNIESVQNREVREEEDLINTAYEVLKSRNNGIITARAYILENLDTGEIVASQNENVQYPIASITKLVTAIISRQNIDQSSKITFNDRLLTLFGNTSFRVGDRFTASDLLYPLLMISSNESAEALSSYFGKEKFVLNMNQFAQKIGAYRTHFTDASGLNISNVSTGKDLMTIMDWIRKNDYPILSFTKEREIAIRNHTFVNPTHLLNWSNYLGGKNGYLPEAGKTGLSLFTINGTAYGIAVLDSNDRDADIVSLLNKVK